MSLPIADNVRVMLFEDAVNRLGPALAASKYSVWIHFEANGLEIDTRNKDTNYFMSCNNRKNGAGMGNSFSICIAYVPKADDTDINYIDRKICGDEFNRRSSIRSSIHESGAIFNKVVIQYGYNELNVSSPRYEGQLLDYNVEIQNGMLLYTLTGYSSITKEIEEKHSYNAYGYKQEENGELVDHDGEQPTVALANEFRKYLPNDYVVEIDNGANVDKKVVIGEMNDRTVFEYAKEVLSLAEDDDDRHDIDISEKSIYYYTVNDVQNQKKVTIKRLNPENTSNIQVNVIFDWMGGFGNNTNVYTGNLVINFKTEFKGVVAMSAMNKKESSSKDDVYSHSIDSYGNTVSAKTFIGDSYSGDYIKSDASQFMSQWSKATNYTYKATLTTVGLPCDIPIGECIKVRPLIYGREHYTSGIYMITNTEDNVDNSGFTTTINLIRVGNL